MKSEISRDIILWYFLGLFIVSILLLGWLLWPFISILIMAAVITQLFSPIYAFIIVKDKITPSFASLLTCILIFLLIFIPIVLFVGILSKDAYDLYLMAKNAVISDQLKNLIQNSQVIDKANQFFSTFNIRITGEELNSAITELGKIVGLFLYKQASNIASNIFLFLVNFFFMLLVVYYLLIDGDRLMSYIIDLSPLPAEQDKMLIQKFRDMSGAVLIGNGVGGLIQGTLGGIIFYLFGLNSPFLWGVIMGLLAFLPIIGIGVVFVPTAIFLFLKGRIGAGLFFIVFYVILSGSVEYLFKPRLVGERVKMHTLIVFLAIMGGLKLFGILGIIYGPLIATAFLTLSDIYHAKYQARVKPDET
jgi:predicted PurR-regulated permease PerM